MIKPAVYASLSAAADRNRRFCSLLNRQATAGLAVILHPAQTPWVRRETKRGPSQYARLTPAWSRRPPASARASLPLPGAAQAQR
jgi:hypothetical protein